MERRQQEKQSILRRRGTLDAGCSIAMLLLIVALIGSAVLFARGGLFYHRDNQLLSIIQIIAAYFCVFALGLCLFVFWMKYDGRTDQRKQQWLGRYGKTVKATITDRVKVRGSRGGTSHYEIELVWHDPSNGKHYTFTCDVGYEKQDLAPFKIGASLPVQIDSEDPSFYIVQYKQAQQKK